MQIEIKRLTPEFTDDYLRFFDTTPHATGREEHRCYCIWWCNEPIDGKDYSTVEKRRELAENYIKTNSIQGYLAYCGNQVVGWCNANTKSACYECFCWQNFMQSIHRDEEKVKSVFCFAIAPEFRGKGIAGLLLRKVCEDAEHDGFAFVEAYPNKEFVDTEQDFMGPIRLYEKNGFSACYEADDKLVMRKKLK